MRLGSISRAVWFQDVRLASILIEHSELGSEFLEVGSFGVRLRNPGLFEDRYLEAKECHFNKSREQLVLADRVDDKHKSGYDKRCAKRTSNLAALNRISALWTSKTPKLALSGVIISRHTATANGFTELQEVAGDDVAVTIPIQMAKAIADEWKTVFEEKPTDDEEAEEILSEYANI